MTKKLIILLIVILLVPVTLSYDLSDYPKQFISEEYGCITAAIVVGKNSQDIESYKVITNRYMIGSTQSDIQSKSKICSKIVGYVDSDAGTDLLKDRNMISIGGPCANKITAQIMDLSTTWPQCATGFENGTGRLIAFNKWNKTQLIVAGYSEEDTKRAAEILTNYRNYNLSGVWIKVTKEGNKTNVQKEDKFDTSIAPIDSLLIDFNGLQRDGVNATSKDNNFKEYLQSDLNKLAQDYELIESIEITHWYSVIGGGGIRIRYKQGIDEKTKLSLFKEIKFVLENKWYMKRVDYNYPVSVWV